MLSVGRRLLAGILGLGLIVVLSACSIDGGIRKLNSLSLLPLLSVESLTVTEGETAHFLIRLGTPATQSITFNWRTRSGSATTDLDFVSASGTAELEAGDTSFTISVTTTDDLLYERSELFELEITDVENASFSTVAASYSFPATILDNDPVPTLTVGDTSADEGDAAAFTVTLSEPSGVPTLVSYASESVTATSGFDFVAQTGTLTIAAGDTAAVLSVPTVDDSTHEPDETFEMRLTAPINATITDGIGIATILDDDVPPVVQFAASSQAVNESVGTVSVGLTLSAASGFTVTVPYAVSGSATAGDDHDLVDGTIVFSPGAVSRSVSFTVVDDLLAESAETVVLTLGSPSNASVNTTTVHTVTINDNDGPPAISITDATVSETDGTAVFTVWLDAVSALEAAFTWSTVNGSATSGSDYTAVATTTVTIPAGDTVATLTVNITDDATVCEGDETFSISLTTPVNATIADDRGQGTIQDDDIVSVAIADVAVVEGVTADFRVSVSPQCPQAITFDWATSDGTASAGTNYTSSSGTTVTIPANTSAVTLEVPTLEDGLASDKTFIVTLSNVSTNASVSDATGTGTLAVPNLDLDLMSSIPSEVTYTRASTATYFDSNRVLTTAASGVARFDHDPVTGRPLGLLIEPTSTNLISRSAEIGVAPWSFNAATLSVQADSAIAPDGTLTADKLVEEPILNSHGTTINFAATSAGSTYVGSAFVKAAERPAVQLRFRDLTASKHVWAKANLNDGTIIEGMDDGGAWVYESSGTQALTDGWYRVWIRARSASAISDPQFSVAILKDTAGDYSWTGDGSSGIYVWGAQVEVGYVLSSYIPTTTTTATRQSDQAEVTDLTFLRDGVGSLAASVRAPLFSVTGDPQRIVALRNPSSDHISMLFNQTQNWGQVRESGSYVANFNDFTNQVEEREDVYNAMAYATDSFAWGSRGSLYTDTSGAAPTGITQFFIGHWSGNTHQLVSSISRLRYWPHRLNNASVLALAPADSVPVFWVDNASGDEGTSLGFVVHLSSALGSNLTFSYATSTGTAVSGTDFTSVTGTGTILAGELSMTINVSALTDSAYEATETFTLALSGYGSSVTAGDVTGTGSIVNTTPPPDISIAASSGEEAGSAVFTVTLSGLSFAPASVSWTTSDGTAVAPGDYTAVGGSVTIGAGDTTGTFTVSLNDDNFDEIAETFTVTLSSPSGAALGTSTATGTIVDTYISYDFMAGSLPSGLTFSRGSTATYFNSGGVIATAASHVPRFDYDPVTLELRGLLMEPPATNYALRSEDFTAWSVNEATVTTAAATAPDGAVTANEFIPTTASDYHVVRQNVSVSANQLLTATVFVKPKASTYKLMIDLTETSYTNGVQAFFDLTQGAVTGLNTTLSGTATDLKADIQPVGNGWFRCRVTAHLNVVAATVRLDLAAEDVGGITFAGDGVSGYYLWGAQLEASNIASSYIPTTSASVTRSGDQLWMDGITDWFANTNWTSIVEFSRPDYEPTSVTSWLPIQRLCDSSACDNQRAEQYFSPQLGHFASEIVRNSSQEKWRASYLDVYGHSIYQFGLSRDGDYFRHAVNGRTEPDSTSLTWPTGFDRAYIGSSPWWALNGHIRSYKFRRRAMTPTQLIALTTTNSCPENYVPVPALAGYTADPFCAMKYEAKDDGSGNAVSQAAEVPWTSISVADAITECQALGVGYDLISNEEWMSIARNIENVAWNWSNQTVGDVGGLSRGHSDNAPANPLAADASDSNACSGTGETCSLTTWNNQRRVHRLAAGHSIWDLAGNVSESMKTSHSESSEVDIPASQITDVTLKAKYGPAGDYTALSANPWGGLGFMAWVAPSTNMQRGSPYSSGGAAGVFTVNLSITSSSSAGTRGFRCVYRPSEGLGHGGN